MSPGIPAALFALSALALGADDPAFRTSVSLVKADAYVYDRQTHAPILDLQRSDFTAYDEDQQRDITYFGNESGTVDILFLLDVSGSVRETLPGIAAATTDALRVLQPADRAAVMAFSKRTVLTQSLTAEVEGVANGIRAATTIRIGLDTDLNQAVWAAADYLHESGGTSRRAILVLTDNMQETRIPDSFIDEQVAEAGAVVDGLLLRSPIPMPHLTHTGVLGFARNSGGEVIEGSHPAARLAEMIERIKFRYSLHFRPVAAGSAKPRRIRIELTPEARRRYPNAVIRTRRLYFPAGTYKRPADIIGQPIALSSTASSTAAL
jgi:hypothetical protein